MLLGPPRTAEAGLARSCSALRRQPKDFAGLSGRRGFKIHFPDHPHCSLDEHLVRREHAAAVVVVVLKSSAHMAAEQETLCGRRKLRRPDTGNTEDGLWWKQVDHGGQDVM